MVEEQTFLTQTVSEKKKEAGADFRFQGQFSVLFGSFGSETSTFEELYKRGGLKTL